jgi:hypothetical protein
VPEGVGAVAAPAGRVEDEPWAPRRLVRTCLASMVDSRAFGPLRAGEAPARDSYAASRRAFVADGLAYNGSIQQGYFAEQRPWSTSVSYGFWQRWIMAVCFPSAAVRPSTKTLTSQSLTIREIRSG